MVDIRIALCSFCSRPPSLFHLCIFRLTTQSQTDSGPVRWSLQLNTFTQLLKHQQVYNSTSKYVKGQKDSKNKSALVASLPYLLKSATPGKSCRKGESSLLLSVCVARTLVPVCVASWQGNPPHLKLDTPSSPTSLWRNPPPLAVIAA